MPIRVNIARQGPSAGSAALRTTSPGHTPNSYPSPYQHNPGRPPDVPQVNSAPLGHLGDHMRTRIRTYATAATIVAAATAGLTLPASASVPAQTDGDFNGDGYADLAVGVPDGTVGGKARAGYVNIVWGGPKNRRSRQHPYQSGHARGARYPGGGRPLRRLRGAGGPERRRRCGAPRRRPGRGHHGPRQGRGHGPRGGRRQGAQARVP